MDLIKCSVGDSIKEGGKYIMSIKNFRIRAKIEINIETTIEDDKIPDGETIKFLLEEDIQSLKGLGYGIIDDNKVLKIEVKENE